MVSLSSLTFNFKAFFHKSLSGLSSLNSSMNSDTGLITTSTPNRTPTKCKPKENKENKFHRFGGAVVNAMGVGAEGKIKKSHLVSSASHFPSLVFGKIKSLWSASTTNTTIGLNLLADSDRPKKRRSKNLEAEVEMQNVTVTSGNELFYYLLCFISFVWIFFCCFGLLCL